MRLVGGRSMGATVKRTPLHGDGWRVKAADVIVLLVAV